MIEMNLFTKQTDLETEFMINSGEGVGTDKFGVLDWHVHAAVFKIDNQKWSTV